VDIPNPNALLNKGAAKQPVNAISANPFLAIDVFAMKSPIEFPHARTVRANKFGGSPVSSPNIYSKSIRIWAVAHIQKILIPNEKRSNSIIAFFGDLFLYVFKRISIDKAIHITNASC
jgi:hypothetical protein